MRRLSDAPMTPCPVCKGLRGELKDARDLAEDLRLDLKEADASHIRMTSYAARLKEQLDNTGAKIVTKADLDQAAGRLT